MKFIAFEKCEWALDYPGLQSKERYYKISNLYRYFNKITWFFFFDLKELELYKEELQTKPALLAVNKMDLPGAQDKFQELMHQLQNPKGKPICSFNANLMITYCVQGVLSGITNGKEN